MSEKPLPAIETEKLDEVEREGPYAATYDEFRAILALARGARESESRAATLEAKLREAEAEVARLREAAPTLEAIVTAAEDFIGSRGKIQKRTPLHDALAAHYRFVAKQPPPSPIAAARELHLKCDTCPHEESMPFAPDDRCPMCHGKLVEKQAPHNWGVGMQCCRCEVWMGDEGADKPCPAVCRACNGTGSAPEPAKGGVK